MMVMMMMMMMMKYISHFIVKIIYINKLTYKFFYLKLLRLIKCASA